jgi:hypothetical protein
MPLPKNHYSTLFATVHKRPLKEEEGLLAEAFAFCLRFLVWALEGFLGFCFCFGLSGSGSFRKGKELLKGKELQENC